MPFDQRPVTAPVGGIVQFCLDGRQVEVPDDGGSLLDGLRGHLGVVSAKDGCSPQGQCGCCTVLVDGAPRVACVTPLRRIAGRAVSTLEGLDEEVRAAWGEVFCETGASQCGFCTPGIILRLEGLRTKARRPGDDEVATDAVTPTGAIERAMQAHLCRCTGWRTINEAFALMEGRSRVAPVTDGGQVGAVATPRDYAAAARRAGLEGRNPQRVGPTVALGLGGFSADDVPAGALSAVPDGRGGWVVAETLGGARREAARVQGRRTTAEVCPPLEVPEGEWAVTLRTSWVEPGYLETDSSWCEPGGEPASPLANGGAFGAKVNSIAPEAARLLADQHGRAVHVVLSREDCVRLGPKRPPVAVGIRSDGSGVARVVRTAGIAEAIAGFAPGLVVEEVDVAGPATSCSLRAAGWAEVSAALAGLDRGGDDVNVVDAPDGGRAGASVGDDGSIHVTVSCGRPLDAVVLRSYAIGAAHMALGWVTSEGLAVDLLGEVHDLTIRSFGVLRSVETPEITVTIEPDGSEPVNGSDAVFAAVAGAVWRHQGCPPVWPTGLPLRR